MDEPDATMLRIGERIELSQCGERDAARQLLAVVWDDIGGEGGDPLHRCALGHSMADVQDDVNEELIWDLRALGAADLLTDEHAAEAGVTRPSIRPCTSTSQSATASSASLAKPASISDGGSRLSAPSPKTATAGRSRAPSTGSPSG